jgi:hypothetical protein
MGTFCRGDVLYVRRKYYILGHCQLEFVKGIANCKEKTEATVITDETFVETAASWRKN